MDLLVLFIWFREKLLKNVPIPFARDNALGLVSNIISNAINNFDRNISRKEVVRA